MIGHWIISMGMLALGAAASGQLVLTASMPDVTLEPGREFSFTVEIDLADDASASDGGIPNPLLQIDVPEGIELTGRVIEQDRDLARNEFLEEPFERMIQPGVTTVGFRVLDEFTPDATLGVNVVAYVTDEAGMTTFARRRVDLPLRPGAETTSSEQSAVSDWGRNGTLQIGDRVPPFSLPMADGTMIDLAEVLGKRPVIITTYRAFW